MIRCFFGWHKIKLIGDFANNVLFRRCERCGTYKKQAIHEKLHRNKAR